MVNVHLSIPLASLVLTSKVLVVPRYFGKEHNNQKTIVQQQISDVALQKDTGKPNADENGNCVSHLPPAMGNGMYQNSPFGMPSQPPSHDPGNLDLLVEMHA